MYTLGSINRDPKKTWPKVEQFWPLETDDLGMADRDNIRMKKRLQQKLLEAQLMYQNAPNNIASA